MESKQDIETAAIRIVADSVTNKEYIAGIDCCTYDVLVRRKRFIYNNGFGRNRRERAIHILW